MGSGVEVGNRVSVGEGTTVSVGVGGGAVRVGSGEGVSSFSGVAVPGRARQLANSRGSNIDKVKSLNMP
jgi:hypothetical protein